MLKLYYEGYSEPIVIGKIVKLGITTPGDFLTFQYSWANNSVSSNKDLTTLFDGVGSGILDLYNTAGYGVQKELFTDPALSDSTGLTIELISSSAGDRVSFRSAKDNTLLWTVKAAIGSLKKGKFSLVSLYDDVSYIEFLKNMLKIEQGSIDGTAEFEVKSMNVSPIAAPFVGYTNDDSGPVLVRYFGWVPFSASPALSFATMFYLYTGKRVVDVDVMNGVFVGADLNEYHPYVRYDPRAVVNRSVSKNGCTYDYAASETGFLVSTFNEPLITKTPHSQTISKLKMENVTMYCSPFIQIGDVVGNKTTFTDTQVRVFDDVFYALTDIKASEDNIRVIWGEYTSNKRFFIIQNVSFWNASKVLYNNKNKIYGEYTIDEEHTTPVFNIMWDTDFTSPPGDEFIEFRSKGMQIYGDGDFSNITGGQYLKWLYNDEYVDKGDIPTVDQDIPEDNGNGGFNDQDYIGGDGVWNDTTVDMTPDRDNPIWNIPNNLGLDGNYTIVKLNRGAVESLASQTWTEDSWLAYALKFSGTSRTADGIANIKTCFCDIPSKGSASVSAIAGYRIKEPLPCSLIDQYNEFNMGTVDVPKYFGSFLDYSPYTEIVLELPFAQPVKIPPEVVVGHSVGVKLFVDVMSDTAMYLVHCDGRLIAQVPANIFITLPFGASEFTQSALGAVSGYVANAGGIGGRIGSSAMQGAMHGQNALVAGGKAAMRMASKANPAGMLAEGIQMASSAVNHVVEMESNRKISQISEGGGAGAVGAMGVKYAVLKISRPYVTIPPRYYELNGCPSGFVKKIGDCKGYLEVGAIYGSIKCNTEEFSMITEVLSSGVFP